MRAHLLQLDLAWEDRAANHAQVEEALDRCSPSEGDLVVLPELFDSGFSINTQTTADDEGETLRFLLRLADDFGITVQGSRTLVRCDCAKARNCATVCSGYDLDEPRLLTEYHKVHPIGFLKETEAFEGGPAIETYAWNAPGNTMTVAPAICYDLRFPELFRAGVEAAAEVFAVGANWPAPRVAHWRTLLIARAIENQAYVLGVNRCGSDPHLDYPGQTLAIDPMGTIIGELGSEPGTLSVELDPASLRDWRSTFPALTDRVDWLKPR